MEALTRMLDYPSIVATSEHVAWTVDDVFRDRRFDPSKPIVPAPWVGTGALDFLDDAQQLALNHCRAFSYVHLLGNFEEFVPVHLTRTVEGDWHGDRGHLRALFRFGEEEMKHQELFLRAETDLEHACGHLFGRYFDAGKTRVRELTGAILARPPLARFLMVLALELGTQRHYVASVRDHAGADRLYVELLKAHWIEEAQHVKTDLLEIEQLADDMGPEELCTTFDHVAAIGTLVDAAFIGQADEEIETLQRVTGRTLSGAQVIALRDTLHGSLRNIMAGVGLTHPTFTTVALALSKEGAATLGILSHAKGAEPCRDA